MYVRSGSVGEFHIFGECESVIISDDEDNGEGKISPAKKGRENVWILHNGGRL